AVRYHPGYGLLHWSEWFEVIVDVCSMNGKQWVTLRGSENVWCIRVIKDNLGVDQSGSRVFFNCERKVPGYVFELEFESEKAAFPFVESYKRLEGEGEK
ncbi:hypothetical protein HDU98_007394, partial [Podochytrium sp. JEL0797]